MTQVITSEDNRNEWIICNSIETTPEHKNYKSHFHTGEMWQQMQYEQVSV
jgi:hypothetical protein